MSTINRLRVRAAVTVAATGFALCSSAALAIAAEPTSPEPVLTTSASPSEPSTSAPSSPSATVPSSPSVPQAPSATAPPTDTTSVAPPVSPIPESSSAQDPGGDPTGALVETQPGAARVGETIRVRVAGTCTKTSPTSPAFSTVSYHDAGAGSVFSNAVVAAVAPGSYPVSATCAGKSLTTTFTVLDAAASPTDAGNVDDVSAVHAPAGAQVTVIPKGAAQTGDGSVSSQVASGGLVGIAAIAGGVAITGYAIVRRRRTNS